MDLIKGELKKLTNQFLKHFKRQKTLTLEDAQMKRSAQYLCDCVNLLMLLGNKNKCILELKDRENKLLKRYYNKVNENISTVDKYIKKKQR